MKIGLDISQIVYPGTGVARFTEVLVNSILEYDNKHQWLFFFSSLRRNLDRQLEKKILQRGHQLVKWRLPPTYLSFLWNNLHQLSKLLILNYKFLNSLDWFITSDWAEAPLKINKATIVHDLVYLRHPETVNKKIYQTQKKRLFWVKRESKIIFTDSQSTKKDIINFLQIESNRIIINYPGIDISKPKTSSIKSVLKKFSLEEKRFILTVGKLEPRKNIKRLIEAVRQIKDKKLQLVIVGPTGWDNSIDINNFSLLNQKKLSFPQIIIKYLGYVTDEELYSLYASCLFFIYPSLWEGFGYPVVEAMKLEAPVACSNTSSLREIAGNAALLFNPYDIKEISQTINKIANDEKLRNQLVKKGLQRSKLFTPKRYYNVFIKTLESRN